MSSITNNISEYDAKMAEIKMLIAEMPFITEDDAKILIEEIRSKDE